MCKGAWMKECDSILIVDDRSENLATLESVLASLGVSTVKALSGNDALRAALHNSFVMAIIDVRMPGMDGYELAGLLRAQQETRNLPIIFLTAADYDEELVFKGYETGAVDYLFKPYNPQMLLSKVGIFLELHRQRRLLDEKVVELLLVKEELEQANRRLLNLSYVDGLTGVPNRRYFDEILQQEWRRAVRDKHSLSLLMIDIDGFKAYNDHYGHLEGDTCLRDIARTLAATVKRPGDVIARYGGEEFVAVLPNTELDGACLVAEEIRVGIARLSIPHDCSVVDGRDCVTVSLGVATAQPAPTSIPSSLIDAADKALYSAKHAGRDQAMADGHGHPTMSCRTF